MGHPRLEAPVEAEGRYFDGLSARPHPVRLRLDDRFRITGRAVAKNWDPLDLRAADAPPPLMRVGPATRRTGSSSRMRRSPPPWRSAARTCIGGRSGRHRAPRAVVGRRRDLGFCSLRFSAYRTWHVCWSPLVPDAVEARLGAVVEPQVLRVLGHPPACTGEAGRAALDRLVARLVAVRRPDESLPADLAVSVRCHDMANALALPAPG